MNKKIHLKALALLFTGLAGSFCFVAIAAAQATQTLTDLPPSREVRNEEFWRIVSQLQAEPPKEVNNTNGKKTYTSRKSGVSKHAKQALKVGGGALSAVTALAFANSANVPTGEIGTPGAATHEYQNPRGGNPSYSSKHSFSKDNYQFYVRVYAATGSRSNPTIVKNIRSLPGGQFAQVKLSSTSREKDKGCGKNGMFGNKWRDSTAYFNSQGWAYFPNCAKGTPFRVSFDYMPDGFKSAKMARTVNAVGKNRTIIELAYYIDLTDLEPEKPRLVITEQDVGINSSPGSSTSQRCKDQSSSSGQSRATGKIHVGTWQLSDRKDRFMILSDILKGADIVECKDKPETTTYLVQVDAKTLDRPQKRKANGIKVQLEGVSCNGKMSPTLKTQGQGVARFTNCKPGGNPSIKLSDTGAYANFVPRNSNVLNDANYLENSLGATVTTRQINKTQSVGVKITIAKPYSSETQQKMAGSATRYWTERHKNGIPPRDGAQPDNPRAVIFYDIKDVKCKPKDVLLVFGDTNDRDGTSGATGASQGGHFGCVIRVRWSETFSNSSSNLTQMCILYTHEYGHLLGYPDYGVNSNSGEGVTDIMTNHAYGVLIGGPGHQKALRDTGCNSGGGDKSFLGNGAALQGGSKQPTKRPGITSSAAALKKAAEDNCKGMDGMSVKKIKHKGKEQYMCVTNCNDQEVRSKKNPVNCICPKDHRRPPGESRKCMHKDSGEYKAMVRCAKPDAKAKKMIVIQANHKPKGADKATKKWVCATDCNAQEVRSLANPVNCICPQDHVRPEGKSRECVRRATKSPTKAPASRISALTARKLCEETPAYRGVKTANFTETYKRNWLAACQLGLRDGYSDTIAKRRNPLCADKYNVKTKPKQKQACDVGYIRGEEFGRSKL